jgi:hypothetical protein
MNHNKFKHLRSKVMFTIVGGAVIINPLYAQDTQPAAPAAQQKTEVKVEDRDEHDGEMDLEDVDDVDVDVDTDVDDGKVKAQGSVNVDD